MKFIAESPDEVKLAAVATAGEVYVRGFLQLLLAAGLGGPEELNVLLQGMEKVAETSFARAIRRAEVGEG